MSRGTNKRAGSPKALTLAAIGGAAAIVAGVAAFGNNVKDIGSDAKEACTAAHFCSKPAPILPDFVSDRVGGGHSREEMCGPTLREYQHDHPNFRIVVHYDPNEHVETESVLKGGRVTYQYHCSFTSKPI